MKAASLRVLYRALGVTVAAGLRLSAALPTLAANPQRRLRINERLGRWQGGAPDGDWVWVHAASVGEARIAAALVGALAAALKDGPATAFVVTCQTPAGVLTAVAAGLTDVHYFPIDTAGVLRPIITSGRLLLYVSIETELWPTLLAELAGAGVATAVANARISEASLPRYRWVRSLFAPGFAGLAAVCARDALSAERLTALGVPGGVVTVTGDIKFDLTSHRENRRKPLIAVDHTRPLLVAASTHEGEDEVAIDAFLKLRGQVPGLRLALVPRHPERSGRVAAAASGHPLAVLRWSELECGGAPCPTVSSACNAAGSQGEAALAGAADPSLCGRGREQDWDVLVVDRIGLLRDTLAGAAAAFVGGSLSRGPGGHNLLEVVDEHLRVITGPYLDNVSEQVELLSAAAAITVVGDAADLAAAWGCDLADHGAAARLAATRAHAALESRRGALARTTAVLAASISAAGRGVPR